MTVSIVVLAGGQGSRMRSTLPKVLHAVGGAPLLAHALSAARDLAPALTVVVVGHGGDAVAQAARAALPEVKVVTQDQQLGTAHAVDQARKTLADAGGDVLVTYGDAPFVTPETLRKLCDQRAAADLVVLGFQAADPTGYGRLILDGDGALQAIVEEKDATDPQRRISLCNSGVLIADAALLFDLISEVGNGNAKAEYYLTDIIAIARGRGLRLSVVECPEAETLGVNTRADLAAAEAVFQDRARARAMAAGVTLTAPETVFFAQDTVVGQDVTVAPFVTFGPGVRIEAGAEIRSFCHLEGCHVAAGAQIGPYARLRPGADVGPGARIGNYVEVKSARIAAGAKVNHLSYVGDAEVGAEANIGAGTITCNYDGVFKHRTVIGAGAFVGSNSALVAPVSIGPGGYVASGSVITQDVAPGDLALGRARQVNKPGLGAKLRARLLALKSKGQG